MGFVRRPPGEVRPAPQQRVVLHYFLSPSRRYTCLVCARSREFNVHDGSCSAWRQASSPDPVGDCQRGSEALLAYLWHGAGPKITPVIQP